MKETRCGTYYVVASLTVARAPIGCSLHSVTISTSTTIMGNVLFTIIWLLILIFIGWWIAGIAAGFYVLLIPFTVCIEPLNGVTDFLLKVVQFPKYCAQSMVDGKGFN